MIKSKLGSGMVVHDKEELDSIIHKAIQDVGDDYGSVLDEVVYQIQLTSQSSALKVHALNTSSWMKKYVYEYLQTH